MKDLVILVADKNMEYAIKGILSRPEALSIRQITFELFVLVPTLCVGMHASTRSVE